MRIRRHSVLLFLVLAGCAAAQDDPKPITFGGFQHTGSFTTGYRFTDIHGYHPEYRELFGLESGLRLMDLSLFGQASEGNVNRFADSYSLTLSGLGGEPYSTAQLTLKKAHLYDL